MNTKLLSEKALGVIDQYLHFRISSAVCSIPYYNNRHLQVRMSNRANIGKGSPKDIFDEIKEISIKEKINLETLNSNDLKKLLVKNNVGIDCSGLAYYILNAQNNNFLDRNLAFPFSKGLFGKWRCKIRPVENAGVTTFAHEKNSREINVRDVQPGDIITMIDDSRNHILIIHQVEYQNSIPTTIHYTHSIAWPNDGEYNHGVRQETIEIVNSDQTIVEQKWLETQTGDKARKSNTTLRRLRFS